MFISCLFVPVLFAPRLWISGLSVFASGTFTEGASDPVSATVGATTVSTPVGLDAGFGDAQLEMEARPA